MDNQEPKVVKKRPKYGGRKKGTPNNKTNLLDALDKAGLNVITELAKCIKEQTDLDKKRSDLKFLMPYLYKVKDSDSPIEPAQPAASNPASQASTESLLSIVKK